MYCYNPVKAACYYIDGGDGSPCGSGKVRYGKSTFVSV